MIKISVSNLLISFKNLSDQTNATGSNLHEVKPCANLAATHVLTNSYLMRHMNEFSSVSVRDVIQLRSTAKSLIRAGGEPYDKAIKCIKTIDSINNSDLTHLSEDQSINQIRILNNAAEAFEQAGLLTKAQLNRAHIVELTHKLNNPFSLSMAQAQAGLFEDAKKTAQALPKVKDQLEAFIFITSAQGKAGLNEDVKQTFEETKAIAHAMTEPYEQSSALEKIALQQALSGFLNDYRETLATITYHPAYLYVSNESDFNIEKFCDSRKKSTKIQSSNYMNIFGDEYDEDYKQAVNRSDDSDKITALSDLAQRVLINS